MVAELPKNDRDRGIGRLVHAESLIDQDVDNVMSERLWHLCLSPGPPAGQTREQAISVVLSALTSLRSSRKYFTRGARRYGHRLELRHAPTARAHRLHGFERTAARKISSKPITLMTNGPCSLL